MRLIAPRLIPVALVVPAFALPLIAFAFERDLHRTFIFRVALEPRVTSTNFEQGGSANGSAGQAPSLMSTESVPNKCFQTERARLDLQVGLGASAVTWIFGLCIPCRSSTYHIGLGM